VLRALLQRAAAMGRGVKRPAASAAPSADAPAALVDAAAALGGALDGVQPQLVAGMGLGLVATRDLAVGAVLLRLPVAAAITADAALASAVGAAIAAEFEVVRDEHAGEAAGEEDADCADWREREARWAREEAHEAAEAAAKKRGRKRSATPQEESAGGDESGSDRSGDSGAEASSSSSYDDDDLQQQKQRVGLRSVLYCYLIAAREGAPSLPPAHVAYAQSLPAAFDGPLTWPDAEAAALLAGTELARSVALMRDHLRESYDALVPRMCAAAPRLFRRQAFSWRAFLWAHGAYSSRCFAASCAPGQAAAAPDELGLVGDSAAALDAAAAHGVLLPLLDIANHAPEGADMCVASAFRMPPILLLTFAFAAAGTP